MELSQRIQIPLDCDTVWLKLNDPAVLQASLPGCESFQATAENTYEIVLQAKVGPVKARFTGDVTLSDINPPFAYTLSGSGKGGVAGFAKGGARVTLSDAGGTTEMTYSVTANVGGKLAQLGARLVHGAARKMAAEFFTNFVRIVCDNPELEVTLETIEGVST